MDTYHDGRPLPGTRDTVAAALDLPAAALEQYIVIGFEADGTIHFSGNVCCPQHTAAQLAAATSSLLDRTLVTPPRPAR